MHSQQSRTPQTRGFVEIPATQESAEAPAPAPPHQHPPKHGAQVARDQSPPDTRVYHTRTIWSLIAFSLLPGVVARAAPELWTGLPAAWHWAAYVCSGVLIVAATILIVKPATARSRVRAGVMPRTVSGGAALHPVRPAALECQTATAATRITTDHTEIRQWAEQHGARPARVKGTGGPGDPGLLRFDLPSDGPDHSLEEISWDEWFRGFDASHLAFLYEERTADGKPSGCHKIISRDSVEEHGHR